MGNNEMIPFNKNDGMFTQQKSHPKTGGFKIID